MDNFGSWGIYENLTLKFSKKLTSLIVPKCADILRLNIFIKFIW